MSTHPVPLATPVRAMHVEQMAYRLGDAAQRRLMYITHPGKDSPEYRRAVRAYERRGRTLRRLAEALQRQGGVR